MQRVGDDLESPGQAGHQAVLLPKLQDAKAQARCAEDEPGHGGHAHGRVFIGLGYGPLQVLGHPEGQHRNGGADAQEDDFPVEVVADLDFFFVFVRGLVYVVKTLGLEEEMADLARAHGHQPGNQGRHHRVNKQKHIGHQKRQGADQVQELVDAAVVVVAVVIPALNVDELKKRLHGISWLKRPRPARQCPHALA